MIASGLRGLYFSINWFDFFNKCLSITIAERKQISEGEIQTYMAVDPVRAVSTCATVFMICGDARKIPACR
ncbi:unnamed protein product [Rhodiola kirilowii]